MLALFYLPLITCLIPGALPTAKFRRLLPARADQRCSTVHSSKRAALAH
jgi:hypothetical protein